MQCNLCGSGHVSVLYKKPDFNILKCGRCRFIFNDKWETFTDEIRFGSEKGLNVDKVKARFKEEKELYYERFRKELAGIRRFKNIGRLLDIGCGYGYFLELAKKDGWKTYGIDCDRSAVEFCKESLSLDVSCGNLADKQFPEKHFDVVTLFHSLEHIPDFQHTMAEIKKILKPRGLIVIDVPNVNDLRRVVLRQDWAMFRNEHLWYFSFATLRFLLEKHGFRIVGIRPHGGSEICFALDRILKTDTSKAYAAWFRRLKPLKNIFTSVLNLMGFNEDILIYAEASDI